MKMKLWNEKLMHVLPSWKKMWIDEVDENFLEFTPPPTQSIFSPAAALQFFISTIYETVWAAAGSSIGGISSSLR